MISQISSLGEGGSKTVFKSPTIYNIYTQNYVKILKCILNVWTFFNITIYVDIYWTFKMEAKKQT